MEVFLQLELLVQLCHKEKLGFNIHYSLHAEQKVSKTDKVFPLHFVTLLWQEFQRMTCRNRINMEIEL